MWKRLSEELPVSIKCMLYNERDDRVYEMDRSVYNQVVYVIPEAYGRLVSVIKPCDYDQWWWCELPRRRERGG